MMIGTLNCVVRSTIDRTAGPNGRRKFLSTIIVRMGGLPIADRTIPGRWTAAQAVAEFRKAPQRFTVREGSGFTAETLKAVAA